MTLSPADSHAKISQQPTAEPLEPLLMGNAPGFGGNSTGLLPLADLDESLWRTLPLTGGHGCRLCSDASLFTDTGPPHSFYTLVRSALPINAGAFSWWATPTATANQLAPSMKKWPGCRRLQEIAGTGGFPHPNLYEWMMGFPTGWTDLEA